MPVEKIHIHTHEMITRRIQEELDPQCAFAPGNANGDGGVSVLDLIATTNSILALAALLEEAFCAADVGSDEIASITASTTRHRRLLTLMPGHA